MADSVSPTPPRPARPARSAVSRPILIAGAVVVAALLLGFAAFNLTAAKTMPAFRHVYVIVLENKAPADLKDASYLNELAGRYALATNYSGIGHPSQPNYIALFSGSTQGVANDTPRDIDAQNLVDQLESHGKMWHVYAENYPGNCFTGSDASNGPDGTGHYVRRHNPAIEFTDINRSPSRCANITGLGGFDPSAADFELIVPNMCHSMHSCDVGAGDTFLRSFVPKILDSAAWQQGGVLFITFDESSDTSGAGGGTVSTLVIAPDVAPAFRSSTPHDHYSLLRTIEDAWHLGCLGQACSANTLAEFFH